MKFLVFFIIIYFHHQIPPFGHIPPVVPSGNMALMYGGGGSMPNGNGTMLISKPLKKPFY